MTTHQLEELFSDILVHDGDWKHAARIEKVVNAIADSDLRLFVNEFRRATFLYSMAEDTHKRNFWSAVRDNASQFAYCHIAYTSER